jgi:hypothetical protein
VAPESSFVFFAQAEYYRKFSVKFQGSYPLPGESRPNNLHSLCLSACKSDHYKVEPWQYSGMISGDENHIDTAI